ncbi:MAG: TIGR03619 family F420-dependent LLM class oxidoreductase [Chloroflexi bacterium]|nr:TIGR03619 family F420-dependent LLM class oxidoreductase [Chloroflexota bacterium]
MKIGIWIPSVRRLASRQVIRDSIVQAERLGYDSIWTIDHVIAPRQDAQQFGRLYDPLVVLGLAAGLTERIHLGVSVLVLPYRHGVLAARMIASLDDLSNGRIVLGVGSGWNAAESAILGLPFERRGAMTDEYLRVMRELWTSDAPSFDGEFTQFHDVEFLPRPVQKPYPPIWVGGHSPAALRRAVEFGDAWHPINRTPAELRAGQVAIQQLCERFGREQAPLLAPRIDARLVLDKRGSPRPAHAGHMLEGTPERLAEQVEELHQLGAKHLVLEFAAHDPDDFAAQMEAFARDVRPRLGD